MLGLSTLLVAPTSMRCPSLNNPGVALFCCPHPKFVKLVLSRCCEDQSVWRGFHARLPAAFFFTDGGLPFCTPTKDRNAMLVVASLHVSS